MMTSKRRSVSATYFMPSSITLSKRLSANTGLVNSGKCSLENSTTEASISTWVRRSHRFVLEHFLGDAAVAAADDQHLARLAVREDRHMGHHLVIDELVARGDLRRAVEHQHLAEELVLEQHQMLVLGLRLVEHPLDLEGHAEAEIVEQRLGNPAFLGHDASSAGTNGRAVPADHRHPSRLPSGRSSD